MPPRPPVRIVVAVDFSDASAAALRMADRLARAMGARLTALHAEVVDVPPYFTETVPHWAETLSQLLGAPVQSFTSLETCDSRAVVATSLVVVGIPLDTSARAVHETLVSLGRTCRASVLFVPSGVPAPSVLETHAAP